MIIILFYFITDNNLKLYRELIHFTSQILQNLEKRILFGEITNLTNFTTYFSLEQQNRNIISTEFVKSIR